GRRTSNRALATSLGGGLPFSPTGSAGFPGTALQALGCSPQPQNPPGGSAPGGSGGSGGGGGHPNPGPAPGGRGTPAPGPQRWGGSGHVVSVVVGCGLFGPPTAGHVGVQLGCTYATSWSQHQGFEKKHVTAVIDYGGVTSFCPELQQTLAGNGPNLVPGWLSG